MSTQTVTPRAPRHLPAHVQKKWTESYLKAQEQAEVDNPDDESAQRRVATKEANKLLSVLAPKSAADIDKLEDWQVLHRGERDIDGVKHKFAVTADGRKYFHPVKEPSGKKKEEPVT